MSSPAVWKRCTIGSLCQLLNGRAFKPTDWSDAGLPIVRIQNLNSSDASFNYFQGEVRSRFLIDSGALLFAWSGTPGTSFGAHIWNGGPAVLNQHIFNVVFDEHKVDKRFFHLAINQKLDELIGKAHGGVGLRHVTKGKFEATEIDLPSLQDQKRLVSKLEGLLHGINSARDELDRVPKLVKRYKQAVLAAAFRGELTHDLALQSASSIPTRTQIDNRTAHILEQLVLPRLWSWRALGDVAAVTGGLTKNAKRQALSFRIPYLRVANVYSNELRLDHIEEIGVTPSEAERVKLETGDLLVVEGNGSLDQIGRVALWNGERDNCGHQNHLIRARPSEHVEPMFLLYWLTSPLGRAAIQAVASSSSGLHTLSITKVNGLPVPCCSHFEMQAIVREIQDRFSLIEQSMNEAGKGLALLDRLEQAVLSKAFEGKLAIETEFAVTS